MDQSILSREDTHWSIKGLKHNYDHTNYAHQSNCNIKVKWQMVKEKFIAIIFQAKSWLQSS